MILDETPDRLGSLTDAVEAALAELAERDAVARTWARDHTLWRETRPRSATGSGG